MSYSKWVKEILTQTFIYQESETKLDQNKEEINEDAIKEDETNYFNSRL